MQYSLESDSLQCWNYASGLCLSLALSSSVCHPTSSLSPALSQSPPPSFSMPSPVQSCTSVKAQCLYGSAHSERALKHALVLCLKFYLLSPKEQQYCRFACKRWCIWAAHWEAVLPLTSRVWRSNCTSALSVRLSLCHSDFFLQSKDMQIGYLVLLNCL